MPSKSKFPVATFISMILIIMTVHNPDVAEKIASVLFPIVWPLFFISGLAAIGIFVYKITQLKKVQQPDITESYLHYSKKLQPVKQPVKVPISQDQKL